VNPMTIPRTIRDIIKYLLKWSRKVFLKKLVNLLYIDKCHPKIASPVQDFRRQGHTGRTSSPGRLCPFPGVATQFAQDPNVHVEQDTTLRTKFLPAILSAMSDTITVIVTLVVVFGAVQVTGEPSPESSPPVHDHS